MEEPREKRPEVERCCCPYCGEEVAKESFPFCQPCGVVVAYCARCRALVPKEQAICPNCGAPIKQTSK